MISITSEQFEFINGWNLSGSSTAVTNPDPSASIYLIRDGGWAVVDTNGVNQEEWMNLTSLGTFDDPTTDTAYYLQIDGGAPTDVVLPGPVNQGIKIYESGSFDYRNFFRIYLREPGKLYGFYDLLTEQNLTELTYRKYALPLTNGQDLKIENTEATASQYTGITITYFETPQSRTIGAGSFDFDIIIDGNSRTAEEIYERVQYELRLADDIDDDGTNARRGDTAEELLAFVGDTLVTSTGVYIDNFQPADTNRLEFVDATGITRTFPFVAAGTLFFNENLTGDTNAIYKLFFTNDDAGDNIGFDFGTQDAIIINQNNGNPITGSVSGQPSIDFDYDYDGNTQRGAASAGSDVPYTAVSLGLGTAQYVNSNLW